MTLILFSHRARSGAERAYSLNPKMSSDRYVGMLFPVLVATRNVLGALSTDFVCQGTCRGARMSLTAARMPNAIDWVVNGCQGWFYYK